MNAYLRLLATNKKEQKKMGVGGLGLGVGIPLKELKILMNFNEFFNLASILK